MKISTVEEMRELDRRAIHEFGIPGHILMENAGHASYFAILKELGVRDRRFVIVCGLGHNGGDGLVVARKIHSSGGQVRLFILGDEAKYDDAPRMNYEMLCRSGVEIELRPTAEAVSAAIAECDVVVDALLGTGLVRDVEGLYREVIELINQAKKTVFSIDIPSGVDGNTGQVRGVAVLADYTVTFGLPKRGHLLYPGAALVGKLFVTHISFPPSLQQTPSISVAVNAPVPLPARAVNGHKGTFGDVLFVAGAAGYFGAPAFAALSLLKAGGGYARLAAPRSVMPVIAAIGSEIVFVPMEETTSGSLSMNCAGKLLELSERVDFVVIGPGLSLADETQELVRRITSEIRHPVLIDGDALTAISRDTEILARRTAPTVLTPHLGEMSRLSGAKTAEIAADPVGSVQRMARKLEVIVVLKGAHSLIGFPDETVLINTSGNSGMATAGSGDVLTGTIAAMQGLGLPLEEAVKAGVFIHGLAGDLAACDRGEDGITARDILEHLASAVKAYREDYSRLARNFYDALEVI